MARDSSSQPEINPGFPSSFLRTLYVVVRNGCPSTGACFPTTPSYEATALPAIFGSSGWACTSTTAQSDTVSYGFALLPAGCGTPTAGD